MSDQISTCIESRLATAIRCLHVPKHPNAPQLRAPRQQRGDPRRSAAVRAQGKRLHQAVAGQRRGLRPHGGRGGPRDRPPAGGPGGGRALRLAASTSRSLVGAAATRSSSRWAVTWATSSTVRLKASALACDGLVEPLTLRTYCSAAARISSLLAGGSKLWSVRMFRHMKTAYRRR